MGLSESTLSGSQRLDDGITTVSERSEGVDPVLEKLKTLKLSNQILASRPAESSLTEIIVRKASNSSKSSIVDPNLLLELLSMYREWQEKAAQNISNRQDEIENRIEVADALAAKLLQRYNYSVSAMKTTSNHLSEVDGLQVELGKLKGKLTEVISNCDALCKRIAAEGPEPLTLSIKPFPADLETTPSSSSPKTSTEEANQNSTKTI